MSKRQSNIRTIFVMSIADEKKKKNDKKSLLDDAEVSNMADCNMMKRSIEESFDVADNQSAHLNECITTIFLGGFFKLLQNIYVFSSF